MGVLVTWLKPYFYTTIRGIDGGRRWRWCVFGGDVSLSGWERSEEKARERASAAKAGFEARWSNKR